MSLLSKTTLKSYFETGDVPTQSQFGSFIDTATTYNTISRADLMALQSASPGIDYPALYEITDAVSSTLRILVFGLSGTTISGIAFDFTNIRFGTYDIIADIFTAIGGSSLTNAVITAHAGGGKPSATPITTDYVQINNTASDGNSALLPDAILFAKCVIYLPASNTHTVALFPKGTATINGLIDAITGFPNNKLNFECVKNGVWFYNETATSYP